MACCGVPIPATRPPPCFTSLQYWLTLATNSSAQPQPARISGPSQTHTGNGGCNAPIDKSSCVASGL
eukprot:scaffold69006_cov16-Prasinocladus_malaysianus.AAC.1